MSLLSCHFSLSFACSLGPKLEWSGLSWHRLSFLAVLSLESLPRWSEWESLLLLSCLRKRLLSDILIIIDL